MRRKKAWKKQKLKEEKIKILNETFGTNFVYGEPVSEEVTQHVLDEYNEILNRMYADKRKIEGLDFLKTFAASL